MGDKPRREGALPPQDLTKTEETQRSIKRVGFEPAILVLERTKSFHALDSAVTVPGVLCITGMMFVEERTL
jgi:hypothetical protein